MDPPIIIKDTEVFKVFMLWGGGILVLKMILMGPLTSLQRFRKKIFLSPEDTIFAKNSTVGYDDPDVNRMRRAHRNDLENILAWLICTWLYLYCSPDPTTAAVLIRLFVICRIVHTLVYAFMPIPQPTRAIAWGIGLLITVYQAFYIIWFCLK